MILRAPWNYGKNVVFRVSSIEDNQNKLPNEVFRRVILLELIGYNRLDLPKVIADMTDHGCHKVWYDQVHWDADTSQKDHSSTHWTELGPLESLAAMC